MNPIQSNVLAYVRAHPGSRPQDVALAIGEKINTTKSIVGRLRKAGLIAPPDAATWGQLFETAR